MHTSLAVTTEGLPLGLSAVKVWSRQQFKGTAALKRKINPTRVPIEHKESIRWPETLRPSMAWLGAPARWVPIGDRESDIDELFCTAQELGTHFLVRNGVDRLAGDGPHTIANEMEEVRVQGVHPVEVHNSQGGVETVAVEIRSRRVRGLPAIGKQKRYPALSLTVICAKDRTEPADRPAIDWRLITDLPVPPCAAAIEKLHWYALRWKVEVFHKILKSGCQTEKARLRTAERLVKLMAVFCLLSWRIFWMTMLNRSARPATAKLVFTEMEIALLDRLVPDAEQASPSGKTLSSYLTKLPDQARTARRLFGSNQGPATWQCRDVARPLAADRHRPRREARKPLAKMWVIESRPAACSPRSLA